VGIQGVYSCIRNPIIGNGQTATDFAMGIKCRWSDSISDDTCSIRFIVGLEAPLQAIWGSSSNDLRWIWHSPARIWKNCLDTCGRFGQSQPWKFGLDISLERPAETRFLKWIPPAPKWISGNLFPSFKTTL
jgi:hypothetical protein